MMLELVHVVSVSAVLLCMGLAGIVLNRRNIIAILMCLELVLLSVNLNLVGASYFWGEVEGQVLSFFILTVAAAELAIGLAIVTLFYRNKKTIEIDAAGMMRG
ncbi:MAG: NADH-quinone oxidoreductase subunit NuoK [Proteobacteria bacterium]|nr:NADH-quinone oxidoreductase subunit NuoK [Pseudomonadota bacterium]